MVVISKNFTDLKTNLKLLLLRILPNRRCVVPLFYLFKPSSQSNFNSLKAIVGQKNSVFHWKRQQIFLSSVCKRADLKSSKIIVFHSWNRSGMSWKIKDKLLNFQKFYLVRARKRRRRNSGYPYRWQITTRPYQLSKIFSVHCWIDSLKTYSFLSFKN